MALFDHTPAQTNEEVVSGDTAASGALSVTVVETQFVATVYEKLATIYDYFYGPTLHPGRVEALAHMRLRPGSSVLEVGVGTGINLPMYPSGCAITGVDLSRKMLEKAQRRIDEQRLGNCRVLPMDAANMDFPDDSFDTVYAPYLVSVVPDPVKVAREMVRVCRPGGRVIVLNHFRSSNPLLSRIETAISPFTVHIGWKADLDMHAFLAQADLHPVSFEKVNVLKMWTLVTCVKR